MKLKTTEGRKLASTRVRVVNTVTGKSGNLVDWLNGKYCRVFIAYDHMGACKLPIFELWAKSETELETIVYSIQHN